MIVPAFWGLADKRAFMYFITNGTTKGRGMANLIKLSAMLALMVMPVMHAASADDDAPEPSAKAAEILAKYDRTGDCLLYTSPSPRDRQKSRMPSSA